MRISMTALNASFLALVLLAPAAGAQSRFRCTTAAIRSSNQLVHTNTNDHDGARRVEHLIQRPGYCLHAAVTGRVRVADDLRDVTSLDDAGTVAIHEVTATGERRLDLRAAGQDVARRYEVDGRAAPYDAGARQWLEGVLTTLVRRTGLDADRRVAGLRARGGVDAVLREITALESDGVRGTYYKALLTGSAPPRGAELDRVLQQAARDVDSDGDLRSLLTAALRTADRGTAASVARAAAGIDSDGDKTSVLVAAAPAALREGDARSREAFFGTARTIDSDGDLRRVLTAALRVAPTLEVVTDVVATSARLDSDGDKTAVLVSVARLGLHERHAALREAYLRVARTIDSEGDYRRAIEAVLR